MRAHDRFSGLRVVALILCAMLVLHGCADADAEAQAELAITLDAIHRDVAASQGDIVLLRRSLEIREANASANSEVPSEPTLAPIPPREEIVDTGVVQTEAIREQVIVLRQLVDDLTREIAMVQATVNAADASRDLPANADGGVSIVRLSGRLGDLDRRVSQIESYVERAAAHVGGDVTADVKGTLWFPYVEVSIRNTTYEGNPFDLTATATFVHSQDGERRETGMFYDGNDTWRARFTGTRTGDWTYTTASGDPDLDGHAGTVRIGVSAHPHQHGFLTASEGKWAWMGADTAFVPQLVMYLPPAAYEDQPDVVDAAIQTFLVEHGFNGFHTNVRCRWFGIHTESCEDVDSPSPNPDPRTFEALEMLITKVHAAGGMVHIWAWGDEERKQTPKRFGINGEADRRLQRYIAARLGPIPGWSMGYGFDLDEWVTVDQLHGWYTFMQGQLGWPHFLGGRPSGPNSGDDHGPYAAWNAGLGYVSFEHHEPTYAVYAAASRAADGRPVMSEDRFRIQSDADGTKHYTMLQTRRGLWQSTMAGGVGNIWGNLLHDTSGPSHPYPEPEIIRTYATFFATRYSADLSRANDLTDGVALKLSGNRNYIVYKQDTTAMRLDLSNMEGSQPAVAVDAAGPYVERIVGTFDPGVHTWEAPYRSDWVLAVGTFG